MHTVTDNLIPRPPVIVVMGHVDHGKTSLLDCIRQTKVTAREAGGITQHLGAYEVEYQNRRITFLDTPGHEAFAAIRQRGSKVADIALLVIAADEGLKPQTLEALSYIKNEKLPFAVVLNKIDRPSANPDKIKQELAEHEVYVEEWGGTIPCILTCATTGEGIDSLLEIILLMADMEELKGDVNLPATGVVLESTVDMRRGIMATLLVLNGTLDIGDTIYTPSASAKIKSIENHLGQRVEKLSFSSPGITMGWETQPLVGEIFTEQAQTPLSQTPAAQTITPPATNEVPSLIINFVLKADMSGSLEALQLMVEQLLKSLNLSHNIVGQSTGEIVLGDLKLAENTNAIIVAFNSKMTLEAKGYYKPERITFFEGKIIYHLIESLKAHLEKSLNPNPENIVARQNIIAVFTEPDKKKCQIVGGPLYEGSLKPPMKCSVIRNNEKIGSGRLLSIRKNKQEMESCDAPGEYGVQIELREENLAIQTGDRLEFSPGQKK